MEAIKGCGITGNKANFKVNLPTHNLSFTTKLTVSAQHCDLRDMNTV